MQTRFWLALACTVGLAAPAVAQSALGNLSGCERVNGTMESSDDVFILWPDRIERWESTCTITNVTGDLNLRAILMTECYGEGEMWPQDYGITPVGTEMFAIWPLEYPEAIFELRMCG